MELTERVPVCIKTAITNGLIKGKYINKDKTFEFSPICNIDTRGNKSIWVISVSALNKDTNQLISIKPEWITCPIIHQPPSHIVGMIQTTIKHHTGHIQINEETIITKGKNIGKTNATTTVSQAFGEAYRKYINKQKKSNNRSLTTLDARPFPMLLKKSGITKASTLTEKDFSDGIMVQPKYDGIRVIAHQLSDNTIEFYSRNRISYGGLDHLAIELCKLFNKYKDNSNNLYLDGEIYIPDVSLQDLSGAIRGKNNDLKQKLEYYVFDLFIMDSLNLPQEKRFSLLESLVNNSYTYIKIVPAVIVHNQKELDKVYDKLVEKDKYEGIIVRRLTGLYKFGVGTQRSDDVLKIKPHFTDEFEVVDYKDGRGRDKGAVFFLLKTDQGIEFSAVPNMTLDERKSLFNKFNDNSQVFNKQYKGKKATIQYADLSKRGVPTQPKFLAIRDYE